MSVPYHTRSDSKPFSYSVRSRGSSLSRRGDESPREANGLSTSGLASPRLIRKMLGEASMSSETNVDSGKDHSVVNEDSRQHSDENFREVPIQKSHLDFYELSQETDSSYVRDHGFDMKRSSFDDFISKKKSSPMEDSFSKNGILTEDIYATTSKMKRDDSFSRKVVPESSPHSLRSPSDDIYTKKSTLKDYYTTKSPLDDYKSSFENIDAKKSPTTPGESVPSKSETYHIPIKLERNLDGFESPPLPTSMTDALLNKSNDESWLEKQLQKLKERKGGVTSSNVSYLQSSTTTNTNMSSPSNGLSAPSSSSYIPISQYGKTLNSHDESDRSRVVSESEEKGVPVPINRDDKPYNAEYSYTLGSLDRQRSEGTYGDRSRSASGIRRQRIDSESSDIGPLDTSTLHQKLMAASLENGSSSRPITPAFPPGTPYNNRSRANTRAPSPCGLYSTSQRRGSIGSVHSSEISGEESATNVKLVKDNFKYWYKPSITREEAIALLKHRPPGTFIVRDSHSFPGAYGLALKVSKAPPPSGKPKPLNADPLDELVRHFLIEPTTKGVRLKGYSNEPIFASLSSLVYQHSLTALALPTKLVLPQYDLTLDNCDKGVHPVASKQDSIRRLFESGAACNVSYLFTMETDALTGSVAVDKTVSTFLELTKDMDNNPGLVVVDVHFKVTMQGITITDNERKLFFRKHYNISTIGYCGLDPQNRIYAKTSPASKIFAFVAKKHGSRTHNQCHLFAAVDPEQPAVAIVNFVNRVLTMTNPKRIEVV